MTSLTDINSTLQNMVRNLGQAGLTLKNIFANLPSGANPTATAGPTAINGIANTFMRSDGAPPVQLASSSQFGIVEVDGVTITASSGVISSVSGGAPGGSNQQVQYNNSGAFGGIAGSVWDGTNLTLNGANATNGGFLEFIGGNAISTGAGGAAQIGGGTGGGAGGGLVTVIGGADAAGGNGGDVIIEGGGSLTGHAGNVLLDTLPTADPSVGGALWSMGGIIVLSGTTPGISATIVTAKLTGGGTTGAMVFTNGILTSQIPAT